MRRKEALAVGEGNLICKVKFYCFEDKNPVVIVKLIVFSLIFVDSEYRPLLSCNQLMLTRNNESFALSEL